MKWVALLIVSVSLGYAFTGVFKPGLNLAHNDSTTWNGYMSLRLMDSRRFKQIRTEIAWVISPTAGNPALKGPENELSLFRIADPDARIWPAEWNGNESFSILQNIDRLSLQARPARIRITVGRQAIFWGVSKSVSPTDFIAPFPYGAINTDYRAGVDAIRAVYPIGVMSEIESGFVSGDNAEIEKSGYWLRTRLYALNTDISILAAEFRENTLVGTSLNRAIGGSVGWIESAVTKPNEGSTYWRLSTGLERSFHNSILYGFLEYHYNSPGASSGENYAINSTTPAYTTGGVYLMAKHYLATGISITATPLLTLNGNGLLNLNDLSARLSASGDYSLSDNSAFNAGISCGLGSDETEFGNLPTVFHSILSMYF
ncbi:MAG: hypothetical protein KAR40_08185 [Candidatus Sabulitectum sp.]|nr:hypothetical protein [Candidatus Sabulitectum sp.]